MKVNNATNWIMINYQARSLFNVTADGVFKNMTVGKDKWLSLIDDGNLQEGCNKEGFNMESFGNNRFSRDGYMKVQIGIMTNNKDLCNGCDSSIGFRALELQRLDARTTRLE